MPRIENWSLYRITETSDVLIGNIYNHPEMKDGTFIQTSEVVDINKDTVKTMNSVYKLGRHLMDDKTNV